MTGEFLIYPNEAEAMAKAEEEGRVAYPNGWSGIEVTKYVTKPFVLYAEEGQEPEYALEVSNYTTLTQEETEAIQSEVLLFWEVENGE